MRSRIVGRILAAQALSSVGTSMSTVALAVMVNKLTHSVLQMGGVMAASIIPLVLTAWVGGAFLDRYRARNLMVLSDLVRAALIFSMPFLAGRIIGLAYVVAALMGVFSGVFNPGQIKLVGEIVPESYLVKANSYMGVARDGAELVGYLVGAVVASFAGLTLLGIHVAGYTVAFVVDAISYVASAALLVGLRLGPAREGAAAGALGSAGPAGREAPPGSGAPAGEAGPAGSAPPKLRTLVAESPAVFGTLWRRPVLRTNLLLAVFAMGAVMMNVPNSYILAQNVFKRGSLGLGALEVFVAVGLIAGGLMVSRMQLSGDKNGYVFFSLAAMSVCFAAVGFSRFFWLSLALMGLAGAASVGVVVSSITLFQSMPASPDKGRLIALRSSFGQLGVAAGFVAGGLVGQYVGVKPAFMATGAATMVLGLLIYTPYRVRASRRRHVVWMAATQAGVRRNAARQLAHQAAFSGLAYASGGLGGPGLGTAGWAAAEAAEAAETGAAAADAAGGGAAGVAEAAGAGVAGAARAAEAAGAGAGAARAAGAVPQAADGEAPREAAAGDGTFDNAGSET